MMVHQYTPAHLPTAFHLRSNARVSNWLLRASEMDACVK